MTKFQTHLNAFAIFAAALFATAALLTACGSKPDGAAAARNTVVEYTTDLQKRDFYAACALHADSINRGLGASITGPTGIPYTDTRACAVNLELTEAQTVLFSGETIFDKMVVAQAPTTKGAPKNGYAFEVKYNQGTIVILVQRDSNGDWKIVGIGG